MRKFPKVIRVFRENEDTTEEYLSVVDEELITETTNVATYRLVETGKFVVERRYEKERAR